MPREENFVEEYNTQERKYHCWFDITYYINYEKEIVVCKIEPNASNHCHVCHDNIHDKSTIVRDFYLWCGSVGKTFIGKSKCVKPDEFDVDLGKKIAYDRAMLKLLACEKKHYDNFIKFVQEDIDWMNEIAKETTEYATMVNQRLDEKLEKFK